MRMVEIVKKVIVLFTHCCYLLEKKSCLMEQLCEKSVAQVSCVTILVIVTPLYCSLCRVG